MSNYSGDEIKELARRKLVALCQGIIAHWDQRNSLPPSSLWGGDEVEGGGDETSYIVGEEEGLPPGAVPVGHLAQQGLCCSTYHNGKVVEGVLLSATSSGQNSKKRWWAMMSSSPGVPTLTVLEEHLFMTKEQKAEFLCSEKRSSEHNPKKRDRVL